MSVTQQEQCYAAQSALLPGRSFASVGEAQRFVDALRDEPWWTGQGYHLRVLRIEVGASRSRKFNGVGWFEEGVNAGRIELTKTGMTERTVLHEVAHVLACAIHGSKSHDPWWARTYLMLVYWVMGAEVYRTLQSAFDAQGVDYDADLNPRHVIAL